MMRRRPAARVLVPLLWACLAPCAAPKKLVGTASLTSEDCEQFLGKFSFSRDVQGLGEGSLVPQGVYRDGHSHALTVSFFDDSAWEAYQRQKNKGSLCRERIGLATVSRGVEYHRTTGTSTRGGDDGGNDSFSFRVEQRFQQRASSHYYYVLLSDCDLEFYPSHLPTMRYELHFMNGKSELPADEDGLLVIHLMALIGLVAASILASLRLWSQFQRVGQMHLSSVAVLWALYLQTAACVMEFFHLSVYAADGKGMRWRHGRFPLDFWSDTCQNLSELVTVVVILCIGCGWTLVDGRASSVRRVVAIFLGVGTVQFLLEFYSRRLEEDFSSFHDHDHWPGKALLLFRCATCAVLWYGSSRTIRQAGGLLSGSSASLFIWRMSLVGSMWLLAYPFTVLVIVPFFPPYHRHCVVTSAALVFQSLALSILLVLFLGIGKHGKEFFNMSSLRTMGDLSEPIKREEQESPPQSEASHQTFGPGMSTPLIPSASSLGSVIRRKVAVD
uniref:GPR180/TMEM145 transmembrane domain-containing protein n=1 Tax=Rhizochromulina marina TaxID=1034831 RepID=A0A7S2RLJ0_9STRA|mmetsp:Transcript_18004/g.52627  ORF Transcript_18004/g.52627 Transcript_18004/m.52627 type:complete len:500 (+) Transcript_18004:3-1502(+)